MRAPRALLRWDEVSLAYAAYAEPAARAVDRGALHELPAAWVGLHPPLHAALWAVGEHVAPVPLLGLGLSAGCSAAAAGLLAGRWGWLPGLVLALSPASITYAAEANNYPLAALLIALALVCAGSASPLAGLGAALAGWGHVLGLAVGGAVVLRRLWAGPRAALGLAVGSLLGVLPVLMGAASRAGEGGTFGQPEVPLRAWAEGALAVISVGGVVQVLGLAGARRAAVEGAEAVWALCALFGALVVFLGLGVAAAHQFPYLSLLAVPLAAAWAGVRGRGWAALALGAGLAGAGPLFVADLQRWGAVRADLQRPRAIDLALERAACGDLLWLVSPALHADDDKTDAAPVLWRIRPWRSMPRATHVPHDLADWRYGHPRWASGLELRTSTELAWGPLDAVLAAAQARGAGAWVVLYDHAPAAGLDQRVQRALRAWAPVQVEPVGADLGLGVDLLMHVPPPPERRAKLPSGAGCAHG
ncbi:MAG: hypothetical protein JNM72_12795 [Deltaproteobacteria bacterium]|nr:hypothetical protein [Deltaproteobacteria bacterium]